MALLVAAAMPVAAAPASAQPGAASLLGSIGARAEVLAVASFDGGAVRTLTIVLTPGDSAHLDPSDGVRTLMTHAVATRVTVQATTFTGPDGRTVAPRLLCAHGRGTDPLPDVPFDCAAGYVAPMTAPGSSVESLGIGAAVPARETRRLPAGLYMGTLTLTATAAGS